ncbi:MAG TPA: transposase, partial [Candidatus Lokiarchaeia archaeon]|nr:transposase [Candidatus Lokiarchaeia archaeon]
MEPVLLFPVVIMIMMAFTLFLKKLKRHFTRGTDDAVNVAPTQPLHVTPPSLDQKPEPENVSPVSAETSSPAATTPEKDVLIQQVKELKEETVKLKQKNMAMQEKNRKMKENIDAYHAKHKQARRAAGTKRSDAGTTRDVPAKNKRSGKPRGKRGGGYKVPSTIDRVVEWPLDTCPLCGAPLKGCKPIDHRDHVITDAKTLDRGTQIENVKHVIYRYRCPGCHQLVAKHFGKLNHAHYGLGLIALAMEERVALHCSWEEIRWTFVRFFHDPDNLTSIPTIEAFLDWMEKWEPEVRVVFDAFVAAVRGTEFANVDETGLPMDGSNWWLWTVVTANVVLFKVSESRGHDTIKEMFEGYKGILISDFWSAYNKLSAEQQKCLAHLVKDLRVIAAEA